jgi:excisionase family DNA binding protein
MSLILNASAPSHLDGVYLDTNMVANMLACSQRTVLLLIQRGYLTATRLGPPPSSYRIAMTDLQAFLAKYRNRIAELTLPDIA